MNIGTRLINATFAQQMQNHFLEKRGKFPHIGVTNKLKYQKPKSNLLEIEYLYQNPKFDHEMQNHFSGKRKKLLRLPENVLPILKLPKNVFQNLWKVMSNRLSDWILVKKVKGVKFPRRIQNIFEEVSQTLNLS